MGCLVFLEDIRILRRGSLDLVVDFIHFEFWILDSIIS